MVEKISTFLFDVLFRWKNSARTQWATRFLLFGLFVIGLLHWGILLDWTNNQFDIQDWHVQVKPSLDFLSQSLRAGQFPMIAESEYMNPPAYLARPHRPFSPQILLLLFLDPATYSLINIWVFYTLSFLGLLLIRKRYQLSFVAFVILFLLFNLNGHIVAHVGAGHMEWMGYFLLPFFILLVLKMLEGEPTDTQWMLWVSIVMLTINLQGGAHIFIYCMTFLLLLGLFQPKYLLPAIKAIAISGLVSMIRILPASHYAEGTSFKYLGGFDSVLHIFQMLILPSNRAYWEITYYIGLLGFVFLFYFGIIKTWQKTEAYRALYLPTLTMIFFSIGSIYSPLFNSDIPFLDSQRAPTRFILVPICFLISVATIQFQAMINTWKDETWQKGLMLLFGIALMAYDLFFNSRIWSLDNFSSSARSTEVIQVSIASYSDPAYTTNLVLATIISLVSLGVLIYFAYREKKQVR